MTTPNGNPNLSLRRIAAFAMLIESGCGVHQTRMPVSGDERATAGTVHTAAADPLTCWSQGRASPLHRYVERPDTAFRWKSIEEERDEVGTLFRLSLVSQEWRGITWEHPLLLFVPQASPFPDAALVVLRHGGPLETDAEALRATSRATGTAAAFLFDVPNQPLFDGLEEDALLAFTFSRYLRSGDESWPLLFPMVKSVVRAMDVIQALSEARGGPAIARYVVAGHSKRGHTAWLSGAADPRVKGIIPIANDVLNSPAQIAHHRAVAGEISVSSQVFNEVIEAEGTSRGRCLMAMIDPFTYRDRLVEPKLVVLGTNDDYTPTDALNLYWDDLAGPKSVLYLPNTTHVGTNNHPAVNLTAFAFVRAVASGNSLPEFEWSLTVRNGSAEVRVETGEPARSARLWTTTSANRDFRGSQWSDVVMRPAAGGAQSAAAAFVGEAALPSTGFAALFAEVEFDGGGVPFKLSTQIRVIDSPSAAARR